MSTSNEVSLDDLLSSDDRDPPIDIIQMCMQLGNGVGLCVDPGIYLTQLRSRSQSWGCTFDDDPEKSRAWLFGRYAKKCTARGVEGVVC